ncbi:MAG: hypothetical protein FD123_3096 [Bacteroidetes bacterium]|nr:MAG: hypothetical protein FD123_3096 [Bacteroidota bacterium]
MYLCKKRNAMKYPHTATVDMHFNAPVSAVWDGLTNPDQIRKYFFGTEAVSDWKKGSTLHFKGVWEGTGYLDKGFILDIEKDALLRYSYFSSFSGQEDIPENYGEITYRLSAENGGTKLTIFQQNIETEEKAKHSVDNWKMVMGGLKDLLEK